MANLKQELQSIEEQLEQLDEQIRSHCIAWAQEKTGTMEGEEIPLEIVSLQQALEEMESEGGRVRALTGERESLESRQKEIRKSENDEEKSMSDFYIVLGRRSFDLYKKGTLNSSPDMDELFKPLLDWEDRIRNADNELYRIRSEGDDQNLWKKMGSFIRKSSQSTIKRTAGDNLNKNYRKIGERLIKEGFFTEIAQSGLSDIYEEFQGKEASTKKLKEDNDALEIRLDAIDSELDGICSGMKPARFIRKREEEKEQKELELDDAFLRLGQTLYVREDMEGESFKKLIDELNGQRERKIREKTLCLTEIRIGELEESLQKKLKDKSQQQEKVEKETEKLKSLESETEELEKKKKQLEKERADLSTSLSE